MSSVETICNRALAAVGSSTRIELIGENSTNGLLCNLLYEPSRLSVLASHMWNFAKRRAILTRLTATPPFEWSYYYELPSGYVRLIDVFDDAACTNRLQYYEQESYEEQGAQTKLVLATSAEAVYAKYVANTQASRDPNQMSILFRDAVVYRLAANIALEKTEHASKLQLMEDKFNRVIAQARTVDTMDDPQEMIPWGPVLSAR